MRKDPEGVKIGGKVRWTRTLFSRLVPSFFPQSYVTNFRRWGWRELRIPVTTEREKKISRVARRKHDLGLGMSEKKSDEAESHQKRRFFLDFPPPQYSLWSSFDSTAIPAARGINPFLNQKKWQ